MPEPAPNWNNFLEYATLTDVGLRRANNQDYHTVALAGSEREWLDRGHLLMVADGMGAHAAGELASKMACGGVTHTYHKLLDKSPSDALRQAIEETNAQIHGRGQANAEFHGMGTTCTVLAVLPEGAIVGHVGDSRAYRLRNHRLDQLTFDHSLIWEMIAAGQVSREGDSANFVPKNIITRSLGPHAEVKVDLEGPFPLEVGDTFMMCSDGLTGQVLDEEIGVLLGALAPAEATRALIDLANLRGGPDNITVIVARVRAPAPGANASAAAARKTPFGDRLATVHPAWWIASGSLLLVGGALAAIGQIIAAIASAAVGLLSGLIGLTQALDSGSDSSRDGIQGPLGGGPHTTRDCVPDAASVANLSSIVGELRDAAHEKGWTVDWSRFDAMVAKAGEANAAKRFADAIHEYALATSFMMTELRRQR